MIKVTVELPAWVVARLLRAKFPEEICGPTIEERLEFWADDIAFSMLHEQAIATDRQTDASPYGRSRVETEQDDDIDL